MTRDSASSYQRLAKFRCGLPNWMDGRSSKRFTWFFQVRVLGSFFFWGCILIEYWHYRKNIHTKKSPFLRVDNLKGCSGIFTTDGCTGKILVQIQGIQKESSLYFFGFRSKNLLWTLEVIQISLKSFRLSIHSISFRSSSMNCISSNWPLALFESHLWCLSFKNIPNAPPKLVRHHWLLWDASWWESVISIPALWALQHKIQFCGRSSKVCPNMWWITSCWWLKRPGREWVWAIWPWVRSYLFNPGGSPNSQGMFQPFVKVTFDRGFEKHQGGIVFLKLVTGKIVGCTG